MKKLILIILALASLLAAVSCSVSVNTRRIKGSGRLATRSLPAPDFDAVSVSRAIQVVITDKTSTIEIEADDNLLDRVEAKAEQGTLCIGFDNTVQSTSDIHVTVRVPANGKIRALRASSAAKIVTETGLQAPSFRLDASSAAEIEAAIKSEKCSADASSAAKIRLALKADECALDASSAAKITASLTVGSCCAEASSAARIDLSGTAGDLDADISSSAKLDAGDLSCANARIDTSSCASAQIACSGKLRAKASSSSSIRYSGDCEVSKSCSSNGSVRKN